jgi:hypothetical protein
VAQKIAFGRTILTGSLALVLAGCGGDDGDDPNSANPDCEGDVVVPDTGCDESLLPFVFIHGTFGSATEFSNVVHLFGSNGYCQERFFAIEYDSVVDRDPAALLAVFVDEVLAETGAQQVVLAGHSQGTGHACRFMEDPARRAKVANYVNLSGACNGQGVPTLSISSQNDGVGGLARGAIHPSGPNVVQVTHEREDHVAIGGSKNTFVAIYDYLLDGEINGDAPQYTTIQCGQNPVTVDGKVVTFGDNVPRVGATVDFFEVAALSDPWERAAPAKMITTDDEGHFRLELKRNVQYEVRITGADGELLGYGYPGPFVRSNYITRFLTPSENTLIAGQSTDQVVRGPNHSGIVARYVAGALRKDWNNSLKIDGVEVLTAENAPQPPPSVVGFFMYDANQNGQSEFGAVFGPTSFLVGTDVFFDASTPRWMVVEWTNEENRSITMKIPNWKSERNLASLNLPYP